MKPRTRNLIELMCLNKCMRPDWGFTVRYRLPKARAVDRKK